MGITEWLLKCQHYHPKNLFLAYKDRIVTIVNWVAVIILSTAIIITGFPEVRTTAYDMANNCDDVRFNQPLTSINIKWPFVTMLIISLVVLLLRIVRMLITEEVGTEAIEIANYLLGILICWNITYIIQCFISYPIPSFYQNEQLRFFYCCENCPPQEITPDVHELDMQARGSFPSFIICGIVYATTYLFLYANYVDEMTRFAAQMVALVIPGTVSLVYGWYLVQYNENHVEDVVFGGILGTFIATYILKCPSGKKRMSTHSDNVHDEITEELEMPQLSVVENEEFVFDLFLEDDSAEGLREPSADTEDEDGDLPPPYASIIIE